MHPMTATRYDCSCLLAVNQAPCCMCRYMCELGQVGQPHLTSPPLYHTLPGTAIWRTVTGSHPIGRNFNKNQDLKCPFP